MDFESILMNSIDRARLEPESTQRCRGPFYLWKSEFLIAREAISEDVLLKFLKILKWTVTISDDADESHALYLHYLPHPTDDPYVPMWKPTRIGNLIRKAKSYGPTSGSKSAASELSKKIEYWILRHPRYRMSDVIISAPPGNPNKTFDLPLHIANYLSAIMKYCLGTCEKIQPMRQQKSLEQNYQTLQSNVTGKFKVDIDLRDKSVIVLDDLYQSGETLRELARACRAAGAKNVLSLAASKTAKFCNGLSPSEWYEVSMEAEQANDE